MASFGGVRSCRGPPGRLRLFLARALTGRFNGRGLLPPEGLARLPRSEDPLAHRDRVVVAGAREGGPPSPGAWFSILTLLARIHNPHSWRPPQGRVSVSPHFSRLHPAPMLRGTSRTNERSQEPRAAPKLPPDPQPRGHQAEHRIVSAVGDRPSLVPLPSRPNGYSSSTVQTA
jgi:hypothetical protein